MIITMDNCCAYSFNPVALRKAKIAYDFGLSECNRVTSGNWKYYNFHRYQDTRA